MTSGSAAAISRPAIAIIGMGRMGRAVDAVAATQGWPVVARLTARDGVTSTTLAGARVAIEFTTASAAPDVIEACARAGCAVISGTTGWDDRLASVQADVAAVGGALLWAPNFAIGAYLLGVAGAAVASLLRDHSGFDASLVETHHMRKRDAPSGTALAVMRAVTAAWNRPLSISSIRLGSVPGEHELIFDGGFEQLRFIHTVRDRQAFAEGALFAAAWIAGRSGIFSLTDLLRGGLSDPDGILPRPGAAIAAPLPPLESRGLP
jgi:4-hydroxy-tetrahydrodipicolinate reductase